MNRSRLVLGVFGMALAAAFFVNAQGYPAAAAQMPLIYSVMVGLLSLAMLLSELLRWRTARARNSGLRADAEGGTAAPRYLVTAGVFALAVGYVAVIGLLGYLLSTILFMALALALIRTVSVRFSLIGTTVLLAVVCLVFIQFLGLSMPFLPSAIS